MTVGAKKDNEKKKREVTFPRRSLTPVKETMILKFKVTCELSVGVYLFVVDIEL